mmetsp:Transcript_57869/g.179415  ORF Transcript_57869/g.179415 Transcript_57869/m.179415 type:complete len:223 (+) Transcript_57869:205-873(+)
MTRAACPRASSSSAWAWPRRPSPCWRCPAAATSGSAARPRERGTTPWATVSCSSTARTWRPPRTPRPTTSRAPRTGGSWRRPGTSPSARTWGTWPSSDTRPRTPGRRRNPTPRASATTSAPRSPCATPCCWATATRRARAADAAWTRPPSTGACGRCRAAGTRGCSTSRATRPATRRPRRTWASWLAALARPARAAPSSASPSSRATPSRTWAPTSGWTTSP